MSAVDNFKRVGLLATIPFLGLIGLTQIGIFQIMVYAGELQAESGNGITAFDPAYEAAVVWLGSLYTLSALPILLSVLTPSFLTKWLSAAIIALLLIFHVYHIIEHVTGSDIWGSLVIFVTGWLPYGLALWILYNTKLDQNTEAEG